MDWTDSPAVNGVGPEIHVTLGPCSNARKRGKQHRMLRSGKQQSETRGGWPIRATHNVYKATSEALSFLQRIANSNGDDASTFDQSEEERENR